MPARIQLENELKAATGKPAEDFEVSSHTAPSQLLHQHNYQYSRSALQLFKARKLTAKVPSKETIYSTLCVGMLSDVWWRPFKAYDKALSQVVNGNRTLGLRTLRRLVEDGTVATGSTILHIASTSMPAKDVINCICAQSNLKKRVTLNMIALEIILAIHHTTGPHTRPSCNSTHRDGVVHGIRTAAPIKSEAGSGGPMHHTVIHACPHSDVQARLEHTNKDLNRSQVIQSTRKSRTVAI